MMKDFSLGVPVNSVGVVIDEESQEPLGSGFVAGSRRHVVTCAHVTPKNRYRFQLATLFGQKDLVSVDISLVNVIPKYDLAVFAVSDPFLVTAVPFGDGKRIRPGDCVYYMGLEGDTNNFVVSIAQVTAVGSMLNDDVVVDFFEFEGMGVPGFSGGPVFDHNGHAVAVMREAWKKRSLRDGGEVLVNRAFSVDLLAALDAYVRT